MTALPTRKQEAWRYSDLAALAAVWPTHGEAPRALTIAAGESGRLDERLGGSTWRNDNVTIRVGDGGRLDGVIDQAGDAGAVTTQLYTVMLGANASAALTVLNHGSHFGRIAIDVTLHEGARFDLGGINLGGSDQTLEIITNVHHVGPGATSRQTVRSVLDGSATGSYLGKVAVARAGQKTDAAQSIKALLLARSATANAKPELEIFADDVKCAHGATVGQLDETALFYLESRGVPPVEARALLTRAFLSDALVAIADDAEREDVEAQLTRLLAVPR